MAGLGDDDDDTVMSADDDDDTVMSGDVEQQDLVMMVMTR